MSEHPKLLYRSGWAKLQDCLSVDDEIAEEQARKNGYGDLPKPTNKPKKK